MLLFYVMIGFCCTLAAGEALPPPFQRAKVHIFLQICKKNRILVRFFRATMGVEDMYPEFQCQSVHIRGTSILPLITLIYTDIPCIRVHLCWSVGHYCPLITLICTDIPGIRVNPCASVGHYCPLITLICTDILCYWRGLVCLTWVSICIMRVPNSCVQISTH